MNPLFGVWAWACETRLILAPPAIVGVCVAWRALRRARRALTNFLNQPPAWDWQDGLELADLDEMAINADQEAADYAALEAVGPAVIDTQPAPEDDTSRALNAKFYADAIEARKEKDL